METNYIRRKKKQKLYTETFYKIVARLVAKVHLQSVIIACFEIWYVRSLAIKTIHFGVYPKIHILRCSTLPSDCVS